MNILIRAIFSLSLLLFSAESFSETCTYSIKEGSQKLLWTGFKYSSKTPVGGTFKKIHFKQNKEAASMAQLLESISFEIDTKSVDSGNPTRDFTLRKTIFSFLKTPETISGKVTSATQLDLSLELMINEKTPLQMSLETKAGKLVATGTLNLREHGLKNSYESLHLSCKKLHTGKDKVAKTWSTVDLRIEADYEVKCSKGLMDSIKDWFS